MAYGKFTPQNVEELQAHLKRFLNQLGATHGIDFTINDTKHSEVSIALTIRGVLNNEEAQRAIMLERKSIWNSRCKQLGLKESDFGLLINLEGRTFKVTGLNVEREVVFLTETTGEKKTFTCSPLAFLKAKIRGNQSG